MIDRLYRRAFAETNDQTFCARRRMHADFFRSLSPALSSVSLVALIESEISRSEQSRGKPFSPFIIPLFLLPFFPRSPTSRQQFPNRPRDFRAINRCAILA